MELADAIDHLRAVRHFRPEPLGEAEVRSLIEAAIAAPTASNLQGWRFLWIDDEALTRRLVEMGASKLIGKAPTGLLVLYDNRTSNRSYADHIHSAAAAIQNILLRAEELGIGSCWICRLPKRSRLKRLLRIPWCYDPMAYIALGYPEAPPPSAKPTRKYTPAQVLARNRFEFADVRLDGWFRLKWAVSLTRRRLIRWCYFNGNRWIRRRLEAWL